MFNNAPFNSECTITFSIVPPLTSHRTSKSQSKLRSLQRRKSTISSVTAINYEAPFIYGKLCLYLVSENRRAYISIDFFNFEHAAGA